MTLRVLSFVCDILIIHLTHRFFSLGYVLYTFRALARRFYLEIMLLRNIQRRVCIRRFSWSTLLDISGHLRWICVCYLYSYFLFLYTSNMHLIFAVDHHICRSYHLLTENQYFQMKPSYLLPRLRSSLH